MLEIAGDVAPQLMESYLTMQSALAADDLDAAKAVQVTLFNRNGNGVRVIGVMIDLLDVQYRHAFGTTDCTGHIRETTHFVPCFGVASCISTPVFRHVRIVCFVSVHMF